MERKYTFNTSRRMRTFQRDLKSYLVDDTPAIHLESIARAFDFFQKWGLPIAISRKDMVALSEYPSSFRCTARPERG